MYLGFDAWQQARSGGAELLWRLKHNTVFGVEERLADGSFLSQLYQSPNDRRKGLPGVRVRIIEYALDDPGTPQAAESYRLATTILDPELAPADELAALYAKRWDVEISIKEVKVSQGRPQLVLRSRKPDGVIQELYGFACVHYAIRWLLHQAAWVRASTPIDSPSPAVSAPCGASSRDPRVFPPRKWPDLIAEAVLEVSQDQTTPRLRANPRVLKRAVTYYPPKRAKHANWPQPTKSPEQAIVIRK